MFDNLLRMFLPAFILGLLSLLNAQSVAAVTPEELCAQVYEQYGVRTEACDTSSDERGPIQSQTRLRETLSAVDKESHIFFPRGGAKLDAAALDQLALLVRVLETSLMRSSCLRLVGHSDTSGSESQNNVVAMERAAAVAAFLRRELADSDRVEEVSSAGELRPFENASGTWKYNRRVEILARTCR